MKSSRRALQQIESEVQRLESEGNHFLLSKSEMEQSEFQTLLKNIRDVLKKSHVTFNLNGYMTHMGALEAYVDKLKDKGPISQSQVFASNGQRSISYTVSSRVPEDHVDSLLASNKKILEEELRDGNKSLRR